MVRKCPILLGFCRFLPSQIFRRNRTYCRLALLEFALGSTKHSSTRTASASSTVFVLKAAFKIELNFCCELSGRVSTIAEKAQIIASATDAGFVRNAVEKCLD